MVKTFQVKSSFILSGINNLHNPLFYPSSFFFYLYLYIKKKQIPVPIHKMEVFKLPARIYFFPSQAQIKS